MNLEMLVSDSLLIDTHTRKGKDAVLLLEPSSVELIVWNDPEEYQSQTNSQKASHEENNFPRLNGRAMAVSPNGDTIRNQATKNLTPSVEAEPDVDSTALLCFGIPLFMRKRSESWLSRMVVALT